MNEFLLRYFTNLDKPVFALRNLPEVVKGTLFSRYSRSPLGLRELFEKEFLKEDMPSEASDYGELNIRKAEKFYDRVLVEYGDDSVAELGGAHLAMENISNLATKFVEDSRIGLSPLEKSSRYVYFDEKINGQYRFYRGEEILSLRSGDGYLEACNRLFDTYSRLIPIMTEFFEERFPREEEVSERAYRATIRAKVCDTLRGLLPASTLTNVGLYGNGRAFEYLIVKMRASDLPEMNNLAPMVYEELSKVIPSFVKRSFDKYGDRAVDYLRSRRLPDMIDERSPFEGAVRLVDYDRDALARVVGHIIFVSSHLSLPEALARARALPGSEKEAILRAYVGERTNRRHRPGRAFENVYYTFEVTANFGAYRDLQRHRILTQERQLLTCDLGYDVPHYLEEAGVADEYRAALDFAAEVFREMEKESPLLAQYVVPFAYRLRWYMTLNLREAFHLIELRSIRQGHPDYRRVVQDMFREIRSVHPYFAEHMKFVDLNTYDWERLEAEKRIDRKLKGS